MLFIPPGEPWRNPFIESFDGRLRDDCLNINVFWSLAHARIVIGDWKQEYNHHRHSALGYQPPARYAASCRHLTPVNRGNTSSLVSVSGLPWCGRARRSLSQTSRSFIVAHDVWCRTGPKLCGRWHQGQRTAAACGGDLASGAHIHRPLRGFEPLPFPAEMQLELR
jgi:hypothetical protein